MTRSKREINKFLKQSAEAYNPYLADKECTLFELIEKTHKERAGWSKFYKYCEFDHTLNEFVQHIYAIRETVKNGFQIKEIIRTFETYPAIWRDAYYCSYGMNKGLHAVWNVNKLPNYYESLSDYYWTFMPNYLTNTTPRYWVDLSDAENIIEQDQTLKYFAWNNDSQIDLIQYISLYRKYPINEMLMKLELYRFCLDEKALIFITENKTFRKWLFQHASECKGKTFTTCHNAYKKNPVGNVDDYYNSLQYRIWAGKQIANRNKTIYPEILKHTTQEKLLDYLQSLNMGNDINYVSQTYFDYFEACMYLRLNLDDTKVLFPHNFQEVHDDYVRQLTHNKSLVEAAQMKDINNSMLKTANLFGFCEFTGIDYSIINAKSKFDLIDESASLGHCVGRMHYDERQAKGISMICFLRKNNELDKPYVTIELDLANFKILQCYGKNNSLVTEIEPFKNEWLAHIKHELKNLKKQGANTHG